MGISSPKFPNRPFFGRGAGQLHPWPSAATMLLVGATPKLLAKMYIRLWNTNESPAWRLWSIFYFSYRMFYCQLNLCSDCKPKRAWLIEYLAYCGCSSTTSCVVAVTNKVALCFSVLAVFLFIFRNLYFCRRHSLFSVLLLHKEFVQSSRKLLVVSAQKHQRSFSMSSVIAGKCMLPVLVPLLKGLIFSLTLFDCLTVTLTLSVSRISQKCRINFCKFFENERLWNKVELVRSWG